MIELDILYQDLILDHYCNPRCNFEMKNSTHMLDDQNNVCGDAVKIFLNIDNDNIRDISYKGNGCCISQSSSSIMCELVKEKDVAEVRNIINDFFLQIHTNEIKVSVYSNKSINTLVTIKRFPARIGCVTLPWKILKEMLDLSKD